MPGTATTVPVRARQVSAPETSDATAPGTQLWAKRYNGSGNGDDRAVAVVVSPAGKAVFVTGSSRGAGSADDYVTIAYNAATGAWLWSKRYNGPANGNDEAASVAVTRDGKTVIVTGQSEGQTGDDYATVAYSAATGAQLWAERYNGPANGGDFASAAAVNPAGGQVFVTGLSTGISSGADYATVAYNVITGAQLWVKRYNGPANSSDIATAAAASPTGKAVFVTGNSASDSGNSEGATQTADYATIAYSATTGARLWLQRYNGPTNGDDFPYAMAVSPTGGKVYVTGQSEGPQTFDFATAAYNAGTGARLWVKHYALDFLNQANSVAVSPNGARVFVTGSSTGSGHVAAAAEKYVTVAYNAATGTRLWVKHHAGGAGSVAVSPTGAEVFVTGGTGGGYGTIAYNAATGATLWIRLYNGPGSGVTSAAAVAVSPTGAGVFVTGTSSGIGSRGDYATIAYHG